MGRKDAQIPDSSYFDQPGSYFLSFIIQVLQVFKWPIQMRVCFFFFSFFGALEISVYIINRNIPAGDCNVIIKYSPGCWGVLNTFK